MWLEVMWPPYLGAELLDLPCSNLDSTTFSQLQADQPVLLLCIEFHINFTLFHPSLKETTNNSITKSSVCVYL